MSAAPSPRARLSGALVAAAILIAAAALRFGMLGFEGVWCDEAYTGGMVRAPLSSMLGDLITRDDAPPLFYLVARLGVAVAGDSEAGLRLVPALAGLAAVALLLARARARRDASLVWAAGFFAVAAYAVFHARQARSYGLLFLFALLLIIAARDLLLERRRRSGPTLALAGGALVLTHNIGVVLVLASLFLWPLRSRSQGPSWRQWLSWHALPLALGAAYWALSGQLATHAETNAWMGLHWKSHSLALAPWRSLQAFIPGLLPAGATQVPFPLLPERWAAWRAVSGALALLCAGALVLPRRARGGAPRAPGQPWRETAIEAHFLLAPLIALAAASALWHPTYVLARTDAIAFPACALLAGRALARLPRWAGATALLLWGLISLLALAPTYGRGAVGRAKGTDRSVAAALIAAGLAPTDYIVHTFLTAPSMDYYLHRRGRSARRVFFPSSAGLNPAASHSTPPESLRVYEEQARALRRRLERDLPPDGAVWIPALAAEGALRHGSAAGEAARRVSAAEIQYPTQLLLFYLAGTTPQEVVAIYRQDWVSGERLILRVPRALWVPLDSLPPVLMAPGGSAPEAGGGR